MIGWLRRALGLENVGYVVLSEDEQAMVLDARYFLARVDMALLRVGRRVDRLGGWSYEVTENAADGYMRRMQVFDTATGRHIATLTQRDAKL